MSLKEGPGKVSPTNVSGNMRENLKLRTVAENKINMHESNEHADIISKESQRP